MEKLLKEVLQVALEHRALKPREIERVTVDKTVQEKAIAFPTDARLYDKARHALVKAAWHQCIPLRQSYARVGKKACFQQSRYRAARQQRRAKQQTRKLRTYLGRVIRDVDRKASELPTPLTNDLDDSGQTDLSSDANRLSQAIQCACSRSGVHRQRQSP